MVVVHDRIVVLMVRFLAPSVRQGVVRTYLFEKNRNPSPDLVVEDGVVVEQQVGNQQMVVQMKAQMKRFVEI